MVMLLRAVGGQVQVEEFVGDWFAVRGGIFRPDAEYVERPCPVQG